MYSVSVNKSGITRHFNKNNSVKRAHRRITMGGAIVAEKVFEDNTVKRATDNLRNLKVSKPRIPKKYISFE
jgi:hypothetical protein